MSEYEKQIFSFRKKIDFIDEKIISLLNRRIKIVSKVGSIKRKNCEEFFIRSSREADMIKSLLKKTSAQLDKSMVVDIWRRIITNANIIEQGLTVCVYNTQNLLEVNNVIKEYYSSNIEIVDYKNIEEIFFSIEKTPAQVAVFNMSDKDDDFWISLAKNNKMKIFAKIPFIKTSGVDLILVAKKQQEKSTSDRSVIYLEEETKIQSKDVLLNLKKSNIDGEVLRNVDKKYLIEVFGYFDEKSREVIDFSKRNDNLKIKILGCYPTQI
jgi:chorismate mutase